MRTIIVISLAVPAVSLAEPVDELPRPSEASGMERRPESTSDIRRVGQAALYVPRLALEAINAPIRIGLYLEERYQVAERTKRILFNDEETFGVYPVAEVRSGFGFSAGAKAVHLDLAGARESASFEALYGGRYDQEYELELDSGERFDRVLVGFEGTIELRPRERFFGIGNADLVSAESVAMPIDPTVDDTAVSTRFRESLYAARAGADVELGGGFFAAGRGSLERIEVGRSFELSGDSQLTEIYDPMALPGAGPDLDSVYGELELRYDTRRANDRFASAAMPGRGWLIAARVGANRGIGGGPERDHLRYTADIQKYFNIYDGSRVLGLRLLAAQIDADLDEIPFVYLPRLGGDALLRGYQTDRFRDRGLILGSVEYKWELSPRYLAAFAFVDAGRVQRSIVDPELEDLRLGFGGGLQLHTLESFLMRAHVASSIDGGIFLNIDFDPVTDERIRDEL